MTMLLDRYSIEATARDAIVADGLRTLAPRPAEVFVPYLNEETDATRLAACRAVRAAGFVPVPHISARRIADEGQLDAFLAALAGEDAAHSIFLIAGDLPTAAGPFPDSLSVIRSGLLERHGVRRVGIAGHPDGHPDVAEALLWEAVDGKLAELAARGIDAQIVTQFSFDAQRVLAWLRSLRRRGISAPVRIGVPGPTNVRTLLRYATRCGVAASAGAIAKYGLSLGRLLGSAGPDRFLAELAAGLDPATTGVVRLHIFPFGGFGRIAGWLADQPTPPAQAAADAA